MASVVATISAEAKRGANLANLIGMRVRNHLRADISDLMTILLLGKNRLDATLLVKSWFKCNHSLVTDTRVGPNSSKAFCEI